MKILIGLTGSVASIKIYNLIKDLKEQLENIEIRIVTTEKALYFFDPEQIQEIVYKDQDEWKDYKRGDSVLHIDVLLFD
jgi:phosphopantothenoylcysteine decarboxylase